MTAPSREDAAIIKEYAASLGPILRQADDLPARIRTALTTLFQRGLAYADSGSQIDFDFVTDANDALRKLVPQPGRALMSELARRAVWRGYEIAAAVRAAADPPDEVDVFAAVERAAARDAGMTVAAYRAEQDEYEADMSGRMVLHLTGVDTDTPSVEGGWTLTEPQLRRLAFAFAALANAKRAPQAPRSAPPVPVAEDATPAQWTGGAVA